MNLAPILTHAAAEQPDRPALVRDGGAVSYGELERCVAAAAAEEPEGKIHKRSIDVAALRAGA